MNQDERDWVDTLAGRPPAKTNPRIGNLAAGMRRVILREAKATPYDPYDPQGMERLLFRLRQEELLTPPRPIWQRALPIAASFLVVALLVPLLLIQPPLPPDYAEPKGFVMPQEIEATQPEQTARKLLANLHQLALPAKLYQEDGAWIVQAELPDPPPPKLANHLQTYGLVLMPQTELLVVIRAPNAVEVVP